MSNWKVIHLKPNTEKKFIRYCCRCEITCYLPLRKKTRIYQRRKVTIELPVFTGYAFVKYAESRRLDVLKSNCVCRVIEPYEPKKFLRELVMVRRALRADPTLQTTLPLKEGQMVKIVSGPFMGTEGLVNRLSGNTRVILNVSAIGQALSIVVPFDTVEVV